jgi:hypothetical protein
MLARDVEGVTTGQPSYAVVAVSLQVFDVKSQRLYGTGAAAAARMRSNSAGGSNPGQRQQACGDPHDKRPAVSAMQAKRSKWQQQSEQLRAAMRSTRPQASGFGWGGATSQMQDDPPEDDRLGIVSCGWTAGGGASGTKLLLLSRCRSSCPTCDLTTWCTGLLKYAPVCLWKPERGRISPALCLCSSCCLACAEVLRYAYVVSAALQGPVSPLRQAFC